MTTLLRYQPKQTFERRYSSSSSNNTSPTNDIIEQHNNKYDNTHTHTHTSHTSSSIEDMNPHYQYLQSLYNDKQRELQSVQHIITTELTTLQQQQHTTSSYNAITEVFYNTQRDTLLQWEIDATNELQNLQDKLDAYRSHSILHTSSGDKQLNGFNSSTKSVVNQLSDTSSSSSSSDDD